MTKDKMFNLLRNAKTIAIIGLSPKKERDSYKVAKYLQNMGYVIIPIYPREKLILNEKVYRDVSEVKEKIDILVVFRKSSYLEELSSNIQNQKNIHFLWTQLGVTDDDALSKLDIEYVQDKCIKIEHKKIASSIFIDKVEKSHSRLSDICAKTPLSYAPYLSKEKNSRIYFKKENLQIAGSFKVRGAFNKIANLSKEDKKKTIICASAGNHAQGVAFSANHFNMNAIIVMPLSTPLNKINGVEEYGGDVLLYGDNYDEAYQYAINLSQEKGYPFIHPYNDEDVMVGQGSIAKDILDNLDDIDTIIIPVGGGGLILGMARYVKAINKDIKIIGVVATGADAFEKSFHAKEIIKKNKVKTIADGIAVKNVQEKMFDLSLEYIDDVVCVDDREISSAILFLLEKHKIVVEGAGAVSVASIMHNKIDIKSKKIVAIISGGNIDVNMLSSIIDKGIISSYRKMQLSITLVDKAGSLNRLTKILEVQNANIVQIAYDASDKDLEIGDTNVIISVETRGLEHKTLIKNAIKDDGYFFKEIY